MKILVIDDSEAQFTLIQHLLSSLRTDSHFTYAPTYDDAIDRIERDSFDVLLVDYDLGDSSGIELMRELSERDIDAPMILLTGRGSRDVDLQAMESGAVDYLDKSDLRATTLERSVRYAVRYQEILRQIRDSENRLRSVLRTIPTGVFIAQNTGLTFVNNALCEIMDCQSDELSQVSVDQLIGVPVDAILREIRHHNEPVDFEIQRHIGTDKNQWLQVICEQMTYEGQDAVLGAVTDITNRKQVEQIEREQRTLAEALLDTSTAINSTLEIDEVLNRILENVGYVIPHDIATITLIETDHTRVVGYVGSEYEREIRKKRLKIHDSPELNWMIANRQPLLISDLQRGDVSEPLTSVDELRSYLSAPLIITDEVIGFINLYSFLPGFFTDIHAERLQIFATQAALAVRNAQAYEDAQERAALEERQRLARDLHDAVSQTLFSASVIAESLPRLRHDNEALEQGLDRLSRMSKGALAEMRTLLVELRTNALIETNLATLLGHLVNAARSRAEIDIELRIQADKIILPPDVQLGLYRITQEALNNIVKHARASRAIIEIADYPDRIEIHVHDNGRGFNPADISADHMGLRIIQERAAKIDVQVSINSQINRGTHIHIIYPKGVHDEWSNE